MGQKSTIIVGLNHYCTFYRETFVREMKFTGVMILGVVLLLSSAVYTECLATEEKHHDDTGVKKMLKKVVFNLAKFNKFNKGIAETIDDAIREVHFDSQMGYLCLLNAKQHGKMHTLSTSDINTIKETLKSKPGFDRTWKVTVSGIDIMFAKPTFSKTGNSGHSEHKLNNELSTMQKNYKEFYGDCPSTVLLGTVRDPCIFTKSESGCAYDYMNAKDTFQKNGCTKTDFLLYIRGPIDQKYEKFFYEDTVGIMEENDIDVYLRNK